MTTRAPIIVGEDYASSPVSAYRPFFLSVSAFQFLHSLRIFIFRGTFVEHPSRSGTRQKVLIFHNICSSFLGNLHKSHPRRRTNIFSKNFSKLILKISTKDITVEKNRFCPLIRFIRTQGVYTNYVTKVCLISVNTRPCDGQR